MDPRPSIRISAIRDNEGAVARSAYETECDTLSNSCRAAYHTPCKVLPRGRKFSGQTSQKSLNIKAKFPIQSSAERSANAGNPDVPNLPPSTRQNWMNYVHYLVASPFVPSRTISASSANRTTDWRPALGARDLSRAITRRCHRPIRMANGSSRNPNSRAQTGKFGKLSANPDISPPNPQNPRRHPHSDFPHPFIIRSEPRLPMCKSISINRQRNQPVGH